MKYTLMLLLSAVSLQAQVYTGVATYFDGLGTPYGGCGVPENILETPYFVALNVFNTPGVSTDYTRPITPSTSPIIGEFKNGLNCGRWVKVKIGANCIGGINDGAIGQAFCRNGGTWVNDAYSDAELYMLVADACGDGNGWCRDSPYHLDMSKPSLNNFQKNGVAVGNMFPLNWNNRLISWEYVPAPNYSGDINIWFLQAAQTYWPAIMINHLQNGIHKVEQKIGNNWVTAQRNSDMGQAFILQGQGPFVIRVYDSNDQLINGGREYIFNIPPSCNPSCTPPVTPVTYSTNDPLPVSILQFEKTNQTLIATIQTDQELYGFTIMGSNEGSKWEMLEFIPAQNNSIEFIEWEIKKSFTYFKLQCLNTQKEIISSSIYYSPEYRAPSIRQLNNSTVEIQHFNSEDNQIIVTDLTGTTLDFQQKNSDNSCEIFIPYEGIVILQVMNSTERISKKILLSD